MSTRKGGLNSWVKNLSDEDMPVFSDTVSNVTEAINSEDTSVADVAQIILRDASLTGRLLKLANRFQFNPLGQKISTISSAVMVLGFDQVRALTLSLVLVDSLSDGQQREKVTEEMAMSFHAAIQAQELARKLKIGSPENIFVATLLSRLGNMAYWTFSGSNSEELLELLDSGQLTEQEAEIKVLGFSLHDLTKELSRAWSLGDLLDEFLSGKKDDPRLELIALGNKLSHASMSGWDTDEAHSAIGEVAQQLKLPVNELEAMVHSNAKNARDITKIYGVTETSRRIPQAQEALIESEVNSDDLEQEAAQEDSRGKKEIESDDPLVYPVPDVNIQLEILQEITNAIEENPSLNIILEMVLEGIYRGVGMDRAFFAILSKDHKLLTCKYALGENGEQLCNEFKVDISNPKNIFHQAIDNKQASHIPSDPKKLDGTLTKETLRLLGTPPYIIMPTIIKGKVIGVFIADRNASKRVIEDKDFIAFQQFCKQANMGLTFLSMQG